jgi:carboxypeptidase D
MYSLFEFRMMLNVIFWSVYAAAAAVPASGIEATSNRNIHNLETVSKSQFWTHNTDPFIVNGSALPDVDFDIGESYAGLLPIDNTGRELFFWFTPSDNPEADNEIVIWLNGGPGCSSLYGFLREQGPVLWRPGASVPVHNPWSWRNLTNIVWIDQPVGTGFSQGTPNATSSEDAAAQFLGFWRNFVDLFHLHHYRIFVTGESFAGQYVPYIADAMLEQENSELFNVSGIMMYDPSIGRPEVTKSIPIVAFTDQHRSRFVTLLFYFAADLI